MCEKTLNRKCLIMEALKRRTQRHFCFEFILISLALIQKSCHVAAYNIASMSDICSSGSYYHNEIRLSSGGSNSAASIFLDVASPGTEPRICVVEIHAPNTHVVSVQLAGVKTSTTTTSDRSDDEGRVGQACPLSVFSVARGSKVPRLLRTVDLCDDDASTASFTELYNRHHVTLIWTPPHGNFTGALQASEIVITAVGIGTGVCKKYWPLGKSPTHFPCWKQYGKLTPYCVATELICDGRRNCPNEGEDEDAELCDVLVPSSEVRHHVDIAARSRHGQTGASVSTRVGNKEEVTILHNVIISQLNSTSTSTEKVLHFDRGSETFPEALARYGPWGYLMLGMLICGSVLMVCGIWECCCRRPKASSATTATSADTPTTVFVVGQDGQATQPPAYDDLDQPPAYNILFPSMLKRELPLLTHAACFNEEQGSDVGSTASGTNANFS